MWDWDADKMFALAGGTAGLLELCERNAPDVAPPAPATVAVWRARHRISAPWLPVVVRALVVAGNRAETLIKHVTPSPGDVGL